jgi:hypothetical protein
MRRRWQAWSDSDRIAVQVVALGLLVFLYFGWPTPYWTGRRLLPQRDYGLTLAPTAEYRVRVNRFTGTVWAETVEGWRKFQSQPLPESELGYERRGAGQWRGFEYLPSR